MVFARSWLAKERLAEQFRTHSVQRRYTGIAHGQVLSTTVRSHLVRDRGDGLRGSIERVGEARRQDAGPAKVAITHLELLEDLVGASLISCRLETGRTHQIRIHLGELGHPLLGERAYMRDYRGELLPAPRLMLHAAELGFRHPGSGAPVHWEQALPEDMQSVLSALRRPATSHPS
jgi:23S rRNA pseudouridine1911/1915/1917 synthase